MMKRENNPKAKKVIKKYISKGEILKYITRFDYKNSLHGFYVRVPDKDSILHQKWFSDGSADANIDDIELALVQAIIERDRLCLELGTPLVQCRVTRKVKNKTGYFGLYDCVIKEKKFREGRWKIYKYQGIRATHIKSDGSRLVYDIRLTEKVDRQTAINRLTQWLNALDKKKYGMQIERQVT